MEMKQGTTKMRRWITLGLLTGVVLLGTIIANAERRTSGSFRAVETGINHREMPVDSHHMCGVGMHSVFGHYTACIALQTASRGIIEYEFTSGDTIYGTVVLRARTATGPWYMDIVFTGGTGLFKHVSGRAAGYMRCAPKDLGVQTYTLALEGVVDAEQRPEYPPALE